MNTNTPFGFKPHRHVAGGTPGRLGGYFIASALATDLFKGDAMTLTATSKRVTVATVATSSILGAFAGVQYVDSQGEVRFARYWPTGTVATGLQPGQDPECQIFDDPDQLFIAQVDDTAGLVAADIGQTADFVAGAGDTTTGVSGHQLDQSSLGSSQQFRIVDLYRIPDNAFGQYAKAVCQVFNHVYRSTNTGI